jgi:hypothetical protein
MPIIGGSSISELSLSAFCGGALLMATVVNLGFGGPERESTGTVIEASITLPGRSIAEPRPDSTVSAKKGPGIDPGVNPEINPRVNPGKIAGEATAVPSTAPPTPSIERTTSPNIGARNRKARARTVDPLQRQDRKLRERATEEARGEHVVETPMTFSFSLLDPEAEREPEAGGFWKQVLEREEGRYISSDANPSTRLVEDTFGEGFAARLHETYERYRKAPTPTIMVDEDRGGLAFGLTWLR